MISHFILLFMDLVKISFVNWIPAIDTPVFLAENLPVIMNKIMLFNDYLPIVECVEVVTYLLLTTLGWKVIKIILGIVNINLGA